MTSLLALALLQAALAGGAAVLAGILVGQRGAVAGQWILTLWSGLIALAFTGGAIAVVSMGPLHRAGLVGREAGIAGTIVLMVVGTGTLIGRRPPSWLLLILVGNGLLRVGLLLFTDLLYLPETGGGLAQPGRLYAPTAAITFPLVGGWLAVAWPHWSDEAERGVFMFGLVGMMPVGAVAAFGSGLTADIAVGLVTAPLLLALLVVHRHRRRRHDAQLAAAREHEEELARALEISNGQLHRALSVRDDLLDVVTHELRTPLTPIRGFLELLTGGEQRLDAPETPAIIGLMLRNAIRLNELIDEALLARKLRRGRIDLPTGPEPVALAMLVDRVLERLDVGNLAPDPEVVVSIHHDLIVMVVPSDAEQILHQVLDNAFRHGQVPVTVRADEVGVFVEVEVRDEGDGIPDDFRAELFDLFSQASTGERREVGGLGLGLGVASRLAEVNGGHVREEDRGDRGACFVVALPRAVSPSDAATRAGSPSAKTPAPDLEVGRTMPRP